MTTDFFLLLRLRSTPGDHFQHRRRGHAGERASTAQRSATKEDPSSLDALRGGGPSRRRSSRRRGRGRPTASTAAAVLVAGACTTRRVGAYSPSIAASAASSSSSSWRAVPSRENWSGRASTRLFGTGFEDAVAGESETAVPLPRRGASVVDSKSEMAFDNLRPPTTATGASSRFVRGPAIGPPSSTLLPFSESVPSQQTAPLFQTSRDNNPSQYRYNEPAIGTTWKDRIMDVSNLASLLCVLDCTLLPLVSVAIPALSWGAGLITGPGTGAVGGRAIAMAFSSLLAQLPAISHGIAIYFVVPVGLLTAAVNYSFGHKEARFTLLSVLGVALVYAANSGAGVGVPSVDAWLRATGIAAAPGIHAHVHNACGAVVGAATGMAAHTCPEGLAHRAANTLGCALLLGSNYLGKKRMEEKSRGCVAAALTEAWGGAGEGLSLCSPGCGCGGPTYGMGAADGLAAGGETFFQWERSGYMNTDKGGGGGTDSLLRR